MKICAMRMVALVLAVGLSGTVQAALHDRGGGLVYDDVLNITWLQDANYAQTSGYDADGGMAWDNAVTWATDLAYYDSVRNVTYTDWRLPTMSPVDGLSFNNLFRNNGTSDAGFNISATGTLYAGSTASEMAFMYYQNLGNLGYFAPDNTETYCAPNCLQNTGLFQNLTDKAYWTGIEYGWDTSQAWNFRMDAGMQGAGYKDHYNNSFYAWAVRDGDVAAVPEPEAYAMMLAGLGMVGAAVRRRQGNFK